jgi:predicted MarR family transcription regulator
LGETGRELAFAEFQHAMMCLAEAFYRYVGRSLAQITGELNFSGQDSVILQVIHTQQRPKSIADIQQFTNRGDISNIQYSVRKLQKAGLVERAPNEGRGVTYRLTAKGQQIADAYVAARKVLLEKFPEPDETLLPRAQNAKELMVILTGLYDQASRELLTRE